MKRNNYDIDNNLYTFNNERLKNIIKSKNPNRGAFEQFYREVVSKNVGISYDAVKGWVKNNTNPSLEDVRVLAEILNIDYMQLLDCTHYSTENVTTRLQKIRFTSITNPLSFSYDGFSNVLDMIIGMGYNSKTSECVNSDYAERIMNIFSSYEDKIDGLPELLGYKFIYSEDELINMSNEEFKNALNYGYVDNNGNSFYNKDHKITLDRVQFEEKLLENTSWLDKEEQEELRDIINEINEWWDYCEMPFSLLKIDINACGYHVARFTYGPGWSAPTHNDRWKLILDILSILGTQIFSTGLCWLEEMHIDQFESEMFFTIETYRY